MLDSVLQEILECVSKREIRKFEQILCQFKEETRRLSSAKSRVDDAEMAQKMPKLRIKEFLRHTLTELQKMNAKLGDIREELTDIKQAQGDDALSVVAAKLDELKGYGTFNSISDVYHKLSQIDRIIDGIRP